jgi:hypothetical protein
MNSTKKFKAVKNPLSMINKDQKGKAQMNPDIFNIETIEEIIDNLGYPVEIHNVITQDGFLLRLYRIPRGKNSEPKEKNRPPVFFQHGLFDSSDCWVCNKEEQCYPFRLVNRGYDVWMGNSRGNKHSKYHTKFSPTSFEFWSFSFDEMAKYDLKATLDYISKVNRSEEKVIYIGHSTGNNILFSGLNNDINYFKSKIKLFIALAPLTNLLNVDANLIHLFNNLEIDKFWKTIGKNEIFPESYQSMMTNIALHKNMSFFFHNFINLIENNCQENNDPDALNTYFSHFPSGSSYKCFSHILQTIRKKSFSHYDYGLFANMELYKLPYPPDYEMEEINDIKIVIIVGKDDKFSTCTDGKILNSKLNKNVILYKEVENLGHFGFFCGKRMKWFNEVLDIIENNTEKFVNNEEAVEENKKNNDSKEEKKPEDKVMIENGIIEHNHIALSHNTEEDEIVK